MAFYLKKAKQPPSEDLTRVRETVREIIDKVRSEGEAGVRYYSSKFDNWSPKSFKIGAEEMKAVKSQLPSAMVEDIDFCQAQIRNFA
jgi:sulfopropanediol 3-dehydrogenase